MPDHVTSVDADAELRRIAHALVAEAPPPPASLPILLAGPRRANRYGRWLVPALAAAAVASVVAAAALVLSTAGDTPNTADHSAAGPPVQRLFFNGWPEELLADGSVVEVPTGGIDRLGLDGMPQPLPGGRFVVLGVRDVSGSSGEAPVLVLTVVNADGTVEMEREVQRADGSVRLLAAVPNAAILGRYVSGDTRIVMHYLQSGQERLVAETDLGVSSADVVGDRLAVVGSPAASQPPTDGCRLDLIDLVSGHQTAYQLPPACSETRGVHVSPSGEFAAVVYGVVGPEPELRLTIVDLADSTIHNDELLGHNLDCPPTQCPDIRPVEYLGLAWRDDETVRVALVDLSADLWNPEGHRVPQEALIIETRTVR